MSDVVKVESLEQLVETIADHERVVVKFTAPSRCAPCRALAPHYVKAAEAAGDDLTFVSVDIDNVPEAAVEYGVQGVPTVVLFEDGNRARDIKERTAVRLLAEID